MKFLLDTLHALRTALRADTGLNPIAELAPDAGASAADLPERMAAQARNSMVLFTICGR